MRPCCWPAGWAGALIPGECPPPPPHFPGAAWQGSSSLLHWGLGRGHSGLACSRRLWYFCESYLEKSIWAVLGRFSRVWLYDPVDCSPPGPSVHRILQARILEWVAMPSSGGYHQISNLCLCLLQCRWILYHWARGDALEKSMIDPYLWKLKLNIKYRWENLFLNFGSPIFYYVNLSPYHAKPLYHCSKDDTFVEEN